MPAAGVRGSVFCDTAARALRWLAGPGVSTRCASPPPSKADSSKGSTGKLRHGGALLSAAPRPGFAAMRAAAVLALCLLACKPAALAGRVLATAPGDTAEQHTAPTAMSLTALAATGSLSLPAADSWPAVESAGAPRAARVPADKRPPVHRTLGTLTPDRLALAFVPDNRPAHEEDEEDESGSEDSDAPAPAPALGAAGATAAVAGAGAPGARGQLLSATVSAQPGRHIGQGGVQSAASVRLRGGVGGEFGAGPALAPTGVDTAAMIGMGSAFGVLGGTVGPSFSFGGVNVAPGERSVPVLSYHGGSILTQPVTIYLVMCACGHPTSQQPLAHRCHVHSRKVLDGRRSVLCGFRAERFISWLW